MLKVACLVLTLALLGGAAEATPRSRARHIVNRHRAEVGCDPIASSRYALRKARQHSRVMAAEGRLFHSPDLAAETGWRLIGEVVGTDGGWLSILRAMLRSPEHRRALLDCRYDVGAFGIVFRESVWMTGRLYAR